MKQRLTEWLWAQPEWVHTLIAQVSGGWRIVSTVDPNDAQAAITLVWECWKHNTRPPQE